MHILALIVWASFALAMFLGLRLYRIFVKSSLPLVKRIFPNCLITLATLIVLLFFFLIGKNFPYSKPPKVYRELNAMIVSAKRNDVQTAKALSFCGMGNIYRCRCEIESMAKNDPENPLYEKMLETVRQAQEEQSLQRTFLE